MQGGTFAVLLSVEQELRRVIVVVVVTRAIKGRVKLIIKGFILKMWLDKGSVLL